jgi:hypothetical protein
MRDDRRLQMDLYYRKEIMLITFLAGLLKLLSNPALLAALIAFLQKSLHP